MSIVSMHDFYPDDIVRNIPQDLSPEQKAQVRENINAMSADTKIPTNLADMHEDENHQTVTTQEKKKWNENHGAGGLTPEQEAKLAEIDNKLDQAQLQNAINQALTEAQQSGLFDGQDGQTPNLTIGTVTTLEPGTLATASITGSVEALKLNLGIPKGASGKDGGYYTMSVTQPDPEHITVHYEPSKPDMPPVDDVTITLPKGSGGGGITDISLGITTAKVGQIAKIKAVNEIGKPTEWEPVDLPSGGGGTGFIGDIVWSGGMASVNADEKSGILSDGLYVAALVNALGTAVTDGTALLTVGGRWGAALARLELKQLSYGMRSMTAIFTYKNGAITIGGISQDGTNNSYHYAHVDRAVPNIVGVYAEGSATLDTIEAKLFKIL